MTDVNPLSPAVHVADRAYRVPLAHDPDYLTELLTICEARTGSAGVPTIDDELALFGAARQTFADVGVAGRVFAAGDRRALQRQVRDLAAARRRRRAGRADVSAGGAAGASRVAAVHQAAHRPRRRRRVHDSQQARARLLPALRRPDRPGVSRRPGVHDRRALRLRRPAAVDRAARARGDSRRRHRSRPHGERPAPHRAGRGGLRGDSASPARSTSSAACATASRSSSRSTRGSPAASR